MNVAMFIVGVLIFSIFLVSIVWEVLEQTVYKVK
jgi:hypothetical protein